MGIELTKLIIILSSPYIYPHKIILKIKKHGHKKAIKSNIPPINSINCSNKFFEKLIKMILTCHLVACI